MIRPMHKGEADLIAKRVVAPELGYRNLLVVGKPASAVNRACGHVQMERDPKPGERGPLGHRLEVIDRLGRLDLDNAHQPPTLFG